MLLFAELWEICECILNLKQAQQKDYTENHSKGSGSYFVATYPCIFPTCECIMRFQANNELLALAD